jgi:hypothetical protein
MELNSKIESFVLLGRFLKEFLNEKDRRKHLLYSDLSDAILQAEVKNPWFTNDFIEQTFRTWSFCLRKEELERWLEPYTPKMKNLSPNRNVAVIMAGNIPLVGFHDFISILISGNRFIGRLSSDDTELLPALSRILIHINTQWANRITFTKVRITGFDAVIATGSNNSANYFNYYFSKVPHIIRKNRNGIAIITGDENEQELSGLTDDIFLFFGLGCRSVSKLYLPQGYKFETLLNAFRHYNGFSQHHKWMNNHDYYHSVFLLNQIHTIDNQFVILTENQAIASPPAVLYYEYYSDMDDILDLLSMKRDEIQVIVCKKEIPGYSCRPGDAQKPRLSDYPDGIDTMQFLLGLRK